MDKLKLGTYSVPWDSNTGWEPGLWIIYMSADDPKRIVLEHEYLDDEWGLDFFLPSDTNILLADGPVAAALHFYYTEKGFQAHIAALAKWWLHGALETSKGVLWVSGEAVTYWMVHYVLPLILSIFGLVGFFISSFGLVGNPEYFIYNAALFGASFWALLQWPEWLTEFLLGLVMWGVIIGAVVAIAL